MIKVLAAKFADLNRLPRNRDIVSFQLGWLGEVIVLTKMHDDKETFHYGVHRILNGVFEHHYVTPTTEIWHTVTSLPEDEWYVIGDFTDPFSSRICDSNFEIKKTIWHCGARHLRPTEQRVWVGCGDAQIFYGYGDPINSGFFATDHEGNTVFSYNSVIQAGAAPEIGECSAINILSDDEAWIYYFGDYPLVRMQNDRVTGLWRNIPITLADAVAVQDDLALFAGGAYLMEYDESQEIDPAARLLEIKRQQKQLLQLVRLNGSSAVRVSEIELSNENGDAVMPGDYEHFACGPHLVLCSALEVRSVYLDASITQRGE